MFALFALLVIVSADKITIPLTLDDNGKYAEYFTAELGECYLMSYTGNTSGKYTKKDDKYIQSLYSSLDCSGTADDYNVTEYKEGDGDLKPAGSYFMDGTTNCSYSKNDDYTPAQTLISDDCVVINGIAQQYETKDKEIVSRIYNGSKCEGDDYTESSESCDTCDDGNYVYCGSSINSIIVIALAIISMLF
ncbi:hypothetical protein QTN25_006944 [Entamoeba marina]